jgi:hypothetical protein
MCQHHDHRDCAQTAESLSAAFRGKRIIDLSRRLEAGIPTYPTHPKYFQMRWCSMGDPAEMNQLVMGEHTGTHIDARPILSQTLAIRLASISTKSRSIGSSDAA